MLQTRFIGNNNLKQKFLMFARKFSQGDSVAQTKSGMSTVTRQKIQAVLNVTAMFVLFGYISINYKTKDALKYENMTLRVEVDCINEFFNDENFFKDLENELLNAKKSKNSKFSLQQSLKESYAEFLFRKTHSLPTVVTSLNQQIDQVDSAEKSIEALKDQKTKPVETKKSDIKLI